MSASRNLLKSLVNLKFYGLFFFELFSQNIYLFFFSHDIFHFIQALHKTIPLYMHSSFLSPTHMNVSVTMRSLYCNCTQYTKILWSFSGSANCTQNVFLINDCLLLLIKNAYVSAFSGTGETLSGFNLVELDVSVHVVASSVKKFFKRLPGPIIPHEFHNLLLAAVGMWFCSLALLHYQHVILHP